MKELFVFMANALPMADVLTELKKSIIEHEIDPTEKNLTTVMMWCTMVGTKGQLKHTTPEKFIEELKRTKQASELLTPKDN